MTQKEVLDTLLSEIKVIKSNMPNGEFKQIQRDMESLKEDISDLKYTLLNPENGVIVNTNKNTEFRQDMQAGQKEFNSQMSELQLLKKWQSGVNKALWIIFGSLAALVIRMLMMTKDIQL